MKIVGYLEQVDWCLQVGLSNMQLGKGEIYGGVNELAILFISTLNSFYIELGKSAQSEIWPYI